MLWKGRKFNYRCGVKSFPKKILVCIMGRGITENDITCNW